MHNLTFKFNDHEKSACESDGYKVLALGVLPGKSLYALHQIITSCKIMHIKTN